MDNALLRKFEVMQDQLGTIARNPEIAIDIRARAGKLTWDILEDCDFIHFARYSNGQIKEVLREYDLALLKIYSEF